MSLLSRWRQKRARPRTEAPAFERQLSYQCAVMQGVGARSHQEDAWSLENATDVTRIQKLGLLAVVADGMGGMQGGALASQTAVQLLAEDFCAMDRTQPLEPQLHESILHAADEVYARLQGAGGSTVIACILYDQQLYYAGLGDSYLYLLRGGKLIRINQEQNVLHRRYSRMILQETMDIAAVGPVQQPQAITGFLGIDRIETVDQLNRAMPLENSDVLLLCSDGVGGVLSVQEVSACLAIPDANEAAAALQKMVLSKQVPEQDNFTAVVIRCEK